MVFGIRSISPVYLSAADPIRSEADQQDSTQRLMDELTPLLLQGRIPLKVLERIEGERSRTKAHSRPSPKDGTPLSNAGKAPKKLWVGIHGSRIQDDASHITFQLFF